MLPIMYIFMSLISKKSANSAAKFSLTKNHMELKNKYFLRKFANNLLFKRAIAKKKMRNYKNIIIFFFGGGDCLQLANWGPKTFLQKCPIAIPKFIHTFTFYC